MLMAGLLFDVGVIFLASAMHIAMLIIGRVLLGFAVAFASVAVTLYNSEMAPPQIRGRLNQIFQIVLTLGVFVAQAINIGTQHIYPNGWRISLALAGMPAIVLTFGGIFLPDTPNSLIERGKKEEGRRVSALCHSLPWLCVCDKLPCHHGMYAAGTPAIFGGSRGA